MLNSQTSMQRPSKDLRGLLHLERHLRWRGTATSAATGFALDLLPVDDFEGVLVDSGIFYLTTVYFIVSDVGPCPLSSWGRSLHAQRLEHRIHGIGVEARLELGEQLSRNRWNILHARHRQKNAFGTGIEGDLQGLG